MGFLNWVATKQNVEAEIEAAVRAAVKEKEEEIKRIAALCRELRSDHDEAMKERDAAAAAIAAYKSELSKRASEIEGWKITAKDLADRIMEKDKKIERIEGVVTSMTNKYSKEISDKAEEITHLKKLIDDHLVLWKAVIDASKPMLEVIKAKDNIIPF